MSARKKCYGGRDARNLKCICPTFDPIIPEITYISDAWTLEKAASATVAICQLSEICAGERVEINLREFMASTSW